MISRSTISCAALVLLAGACSQDSQRSPVGIRTVSVPLFTANADNLGTHLRGDEEVPARPTLATGQAIFRISDDGSAISYRLIATNIENVVQAHIHVGAAGVNGPITVFLFGPVSAGGGRHDGVLAEGTFTAANLIGPLAGQPLSALIDLLHSGGTYVNVHTNNGVGVPNEGPGDFPGGEIRGQVVHPVGQ